MISSDRNKAKERLANSLPEWDDFVSDRHDSVDFAKMASAFGDNT